MAARGTRNMDQGEESIEDKNLIERLRARAKGVHRRAIITALITTVVVLVFPNP